MTEYASKLVANIKGLMKEGCTRELINSHSSLERTAHVRIEFLACVHPLGFKVGTH